MIKLHLHGDNLREPLLPRTFKRIDRSHTATKRKSIIFETLLESKDVCKDLLKHLGKDAIIALVAAPATTYDSKFKWNDSNIRRSESSKKAKPTAAKYQDLVKKGAIKTAEDEMDVDEDDDKMNLDEDDDMDDAAADTESPSRAKSKRRNRLRRLVPRQSLCPVHARGALWLRDRLTSHQRRFNDHSHCRWYEDDGRADRQICLSQGQEVSNAANDFTRYKIDMEPVFLGFGSTGLVVVF